MASPGVSVADREKTDGRSSTSIESRQEDRGMTGEYVPLTMSSLRSSQPATIALSLVLGYVALGVLFYAQVTDWTLLQSFYFVIVTLTSIGYGDLTPSGTGVRLFTACYILLGVAILGTALGEVVSSLLKVDETANGRIVKWLSGAKVVNPDDQGNANEDSSEQSEFVQLLGGSDAASAVATTLPIVAACLAFGSIAFYFLEPGIALTDAFYYAVVTLTTVGYGDFSPQTEVSQIFLCAYALFGTILLARSLGAIAALPLERERKYKQNLVLEQYGGELDAEELVDLKTTLIELDLCGTERTYCSRSDFALAMLVRQDKLTEEDVTLVLKTFDKLDIDGSGELDEDDVKAW
eukprot:CAMPEP_0119314432 /NCGR_PEP_ID=MMETSP1333-20130426/32714_1 /TAXON_ID=418940 /ORGANISM="Scyphosphaera apsteinii, Strain RCC1455" /LENGTH=350 /DNA_ID=CAMNT_0007319537 /DNA_START=200 /DNA_END=1249 /DNA_ORIENTATION=+